MEVAKMGNIHFIKRFSLICFIVIFGIIIISPVHAVSQAAVLFLLISPSPLANGMGETYGNIASIDPMASIFNPAYLGFYSQKHNFGFSYSKTDWLPQLVSDMEYSCTSLNFGFALKKIPLSLGFGYHRIFFENWETVSIIDESGSPIILEASKAWDKANILSLSAALDYYINASIGFSFKFIESYLPPLIVPGFPPSREAKASVNAYDFGVVVQAPLFKMISKLTDNSLSIIPYVKPYLEPSFSYSVTNIGDEVKYIDTAQGDPLPRTVYTGINISAGLRYSKNNYDFNIVSFHWAREANDFLIEGNGDYKYLSGFNDIDFIDNIILGKSNTNIITNRGWELRFGDMFFVRAGHYKDIEGKVIYDTNGLGVNFIQPLRLILELTNLKIENDLIKKVLYNLDIEYHRSEFDCEQGHPLSDTKFNCLVLKLRNIFEL